MPNIYLKSQLKLKYLTMHKKRHILFITLKEIQKGGTFIYKLLAEP